MKIYQVMFDTILITALAESKEDFIDLLMDEDDGYDLKDGELFYDFGGPIVECFISEVEMERGIIQSESH